MTPDATLRLIRERLDAGVSPIDLIEELVPSSRDDAVSWVRRLPGWEEHPFPERVIALARIVSRRAMKEHGLSITEDGRVTDGDCKMPVNPQPTRVFTLNIAGEGVRLEYFRDYFPRTGTDLFQFRSPHDPVQPIPVSETGWWAQYVHRDVVEAYGGPQVYAEQLAQAKVEGRAEEFIAAFEGERPSEKRKKKPVIGKHTGEVVAERAEMSENPPDSPPGKLF